MNKLRTQLFINKKVNIYEMFLRDGLQSLKKSFLLNDKILFFNLIKECNIKNIEFGSTTNPKILPQMADSFILWDNLKKYKKNKTLTMLVTDKKYFKKSLESGIESFGLLSSVSNLFSKSNLKKDSNEAFYDMINIFTSIFDMKNDNNKFHVRLYLSCSFGTNKEKCDEEYIEILYRQILIINNLIQKYNLEYENVDIVLCDTYGILDVEIMKNVLNKITKIKGIENFLSLHLHTNEDFYDFIDIGLKYKIYKYDSSILNIGGCPFSGKKNVGNINTLNLVKYLEKNNYDTGINIEKLEEYQLIIKKKLEE
jgi:hydroxymethylglutaryl-CoA lyase